MIEINIILIIVKVIWNNIDKKLNFGFILMLGICFFLVNCWLYLIDSWFFFDIFNLYLLLFLGIILYKFFFML